MARIGIVYYSMYGHTFELAQRIGDGVAKAGGTAEVRRVAETLPQSIVDEQGLQPIIDRQSEVARPADVEELREFDGIVIGTPTRYGGPTSQLQAFLDQTGPLWASGGLVGKAAGFFTGASTIHGGHESTILSLSTFAFHQGMVVVPAGYSFAEMGSTRTGGTPYGPSAWSPQEGKDGLDDDETAIAVQYGAFFHRIAAKLAA